MISVRLKTALMVWFDDKEHGMAQWTDQKCEFGNVVQTGPAEGNKYPCTCGLLELQAALQYEATE